MKTLKTSYIIALTLTCSLAPTLKAQNLYVANSFNNTVGEYGLNGSTVNASEISGLHSPYAIAISGNDVFVANYFPGTIGEYTTAGGTVNGALITGLIDPEGIAILGNEMFVSSSTGTIGEYSTTGGT